MLRVFPRFRDGSLEGNRFGEVAEPCTPACNVGQSIRPVIPWVGSAPRIPFCVASSLACSICADNDGGAMPSFSAAEGNASFDGLAIIAAGFSTWITQVTHRLTKRSRNRGHPADCSGQSCEHCHCPRSTKSPADKLPTPGNQRNKSVLLYTAQNIR